MAIKNGTIRNNLLNGTTSNDVLNGLAGNDTLNGNSGNDMLNGGEGIDKMSGGKGDDYYLVDNFKDIVTEFLNSGNDTVETSLITYTLPNNAENLIFSSSQNSRGVGNKLNNKIVGKDGNDTLIGNAGNDILIGDTGNDTAVFNNSKNQYNITSKINSNGTTQLNVKFIGTVKTGVINDGEDTLTNIEFLQFSDGILNVQEFLNPKIETPPPVVEKPISNPTSNFEAKAPFVYQTNNVNQLDSITTLLSYSPNVTNGVDYSKFETEQWRIRGSDSELAIDLTQTNKATNQIILNGNLNALEKAQTWYKIHLNQAGTLNVQDLSQNADVIDAALFSSDGTNGMTYFSSIFDSTEQLKRYVNLPAGDYELRIDKGDTTANAKLNQTADFKILINTEPSDDFILPALQFNAQTSKIHIELPPQQKEIYYKFKIDNTAKFTLDATQFAQDFEFRLFKSNTNGNGLSGVGYTFFSNKPDAQIYDLNAGTYYLNVNSNSISANLKTFDVPVIASSTTFNTAFNNVTPQILKADIENPVMPFQRDSDGNFVLTYSFDLNKIVDSSDALPNPTTFTTAQQVAVRSAFQEYANIAKLKFIEVPNSSSEKADITFVNVSSLGSAAGDTLASTSWMNDFIRALIRIDLSDDSNADVSVGSYGYATLLHEIGHALGLKHPQEYADGGDSALPYLIDAKDNNQYTLMSYNDYPNKTPNGYDLNSNVAATAEQTPLLYDIAAIQALYGANTNFNSQNTVYRWDTNSNPHMTIWDTAGVDIIDASNQLQPQIIDLRAGEFSSIGAATLQYENNEKELYPAKDNVSIAYDTVIEKVIGGVGDDIMIGNSVANQLTGGLGNDDFVFASKLSAFNVDTITDFNVGDKLILNRSIFNGLNSGNQLQSNEFLAGNSVSAAENSLQRIIFNQLTQSLFYDSDGVGGAEPIQFAILNNVSLVNANQIFIQS